MKQKLDEIQQKAVTHGGGPLLVTAGPGSGKTTVITHHIQFLIHSLGVQPENILVITFTKSAATEMKERFLRLEGLNETKVVFGTFHAFFFQILRQSGGFSHNSILKDKEKYIFLRDILKEEKITFYENSFLEELLSEISRTKNKQNLLLFESGILEKETFLKVYKEYERRLEAVHKIDFDDMVIRCMELFQQQPAILRKWQECFRFILVDEFQDINPQQYTMVKMLAEPHHNIFAVGDEDQSIYSFRGANPGICFSFLEDYPEAEQVFLTTNYRCNGHIVEGAKKLISNNKLRFPKKIEAKKNKTTEEEETKEGLFIREFHYEKEEYEAIAKQIKEYSHTHALKDCVVLFRTNMISPLFFSCLKKYKVPYLTKTSIQNWQENSTVKDIQAYFALAEGELTRKNLFRIMNKPVRYFTRDMIKEDVFTWESLESRAMGRFYLMDQIQKLRKDLDYINKLPVYAALRYIRRAVGYDTWLKEQGGKVLYNGEEMLENLRILSKECDTFQELWELMEKEEMPETEVEQNCVSIMTYHGAKGLEWPVVILPDVMEGITPYKRAKSEEETEEERRMFYVALTRAKDSVYLYTLYPDETHKKTPSTFIKEVKGE